MSFPDKWVVTPKTIEQSTVVTKWFNDLGVRGEYSREMIHGDSGKYFKYFFPNYCPNGILDHPRFASEYQFCYIDPIPGYTEIDFETFCVIIELMRQGKIETKLRDITNDKIEL